MELEERGQIVVGGTRSHWRACVGERHRRARRVGQAGWSSAIDTECGTGCVDGGRDARICCRASGAIGEPLIATLLKHDAAATTFAALTADPSVYNLVDKDPSPQALWLPGVYQVRGCSGATTYQRDAGDRDRWRRFGVLRDEAERGLEREGQAGTSVEAPSARVALGELVKRAADEWTTHLKEAQLPVRVTRDADACRSADVLRLTNSRPKPKRIAGAQVHSVQPAVYVQRSRKTARPFRQISYVVGPSGPLHQRYSFQRLNGAQQHAGANSRFFCGDIEHVGRSNSERIWSRCISGNSEGCDCPK